MKQTLKWVPIRDGAFKEKIIAVAGTDASGSMQVLFPLYDPRDADYSGTIDPLEKFSDFFSRGFSRQAQEAKILWTAAAELGDPIQWSNAQKSLYRDAFRYVLTQIDKQYVTGLISGSVGKIVETAILARGVSPILGYFVKLGAEKTVSAVIDSFKKN